MTKKVTELVEALDLEVADGTATPRETLQLVKAFYRIECEKGRAEVIRDVERKAEEDERKRRH